MQKRPRHTLKKMDLTPEEVERKFLGLVEKTPTCWIWLGGRVTDSYGQFYFNGLRLPAHRFSYLIYVEEIPPHHIVGHKCDNKYCVNPEHLEAISMSQNAKDALARGLRKPPPKIVGRKGRGFAQKRCDT